jgi:hypothetical protein
METPEKGYQGHFIEVTFPGQLPFKITTGVDVLPRTYPFEAFVPERKLAAAN